MVRLSCASRCRVLPRKIHFVAARSLLALLLVSTSASNVAAQAQPADYRFNLANSATSAAGFIAAADRSWVEVYAEAKGDVNGDGKADLVVAVGVSRARWDDDAVARDVIADQQPVFFIALGGSSAKFTRSVTSVKLLGCYSCGGAFTGFTPFFDLSVSRGSVKVAQESGSRELVDRVHTFRISGTKTQLIGYDTVLTDRLEPNVCTESFNLATKKVEVTKDVNGSIEKKTGTFTLSKPTILLADVERTDINRLLTKVTIGTRCGG